MITILTADGVQVPLATTVISGVHYPVNLPVWLPFQEVFASSARAYNDVADTTIHYSDTISLPTPVGYRLGTVITDWTTPGDIDLYATLHVYMEGSLDGTSWEAIDDTTYDYNDVGLGMTNYEPPTPYVRVGYLALVGTGGNYLTDTVTFSCLLQQTPYI